MYHLVRNIFFMTLFDRLLTLNYTYFCKVVLICNCLLPNGEGVGLKIKRSWGFDSHSALMYKCWENFSFHASSAYLSDMYLVEQESYIVMIGYNCGRMRRGNTIVLFFSKCFRDGFLLIKNSLSRSGRRNLET